MPVMAFPLILAFIAQSGTSGDYQTAPDQTAYDAAYARAFRDSFRTRSIEQCRVSAGNAGAAGIDVTPICACVTDRLLATKSVEALKTQPPVAELRSLSTACIAAHPPVPRSAKP